MSDSALQNLIRIGKVSAVDASALTARVIFEDKGGHVSPPLKVIQRPPPIVVEETTLTYGVLPGGPENHAHTGITEAHTHKAYNQNWLPPVGAYVLCVFLPGGDGDGFVIGGV